MLGWARVRSFVTSLALLFAFAFALDLAAPDGCCSADGCRSEIAAAQAAADQAAADQAAADQAAVDDASAHRAEGCASDECPPGCDDGCACCARLTGVPATARPALGARVVHTIAYAGETQVAPPAPEPRDRDAVPRRARAA